MYGLTLCQFLHGTLRSSTSRLSYAASSSFSCSATCKGAGCLNRLL